MCLPVYLTGKEEFTWYVEIIFILKLQGKRKKSILIPTGKHVFKISKKNTIESRQKRLPGDFITKFEKGSTVTLKNHFHSGLDYVLCEYLVLLTLL